MIQSSNEIKGARSVVMNAEVCDIQDTTSHLRQISLKHELLKEVGFLAPGAHFKLFIPLNKAAQAILPDVSTGRPFWADKKNKPHVRTYTVRNIDRISGILDVEFVLHGDGSPASGWALNASIGDYLGIGIKKSGRVHDHADWFLFAGDETATPAIATMLEALPTAATGIAFLETDGILDQFKINTKSSVEIRWLSRNGKHPEESDLLLNAVKNMILPDPLLQSRYVWIAGEDNMVRSIRKYAAEQMTLGREELHATVYWKAGLSEDAYQKMRRAE